MKGKMVDIVDEFNYFFYNDVGWLMKNYSNILFIVYNKL